MESTNAYSSDKKHQTANTQQTRFDGYGLFVGMCLALGMCAGSIFVVKNLEKSRTEKQKIQQQEFARKILDDYRTEQARTKTVNIDSLINQHIR